MLYGWEDRTVTRERLRALLNRGAALGLSLERWERAGLWVLTRSDSDYPERLKRRLGGTAPPVLFGCGNRALLERGGIAVVGSRNTGEDDLEFARRLGAKAAEEGYAVVSGGARGIDRCAMHGALERDGTALGVLADSLLRSAMAADYRRYILSGDLALVSPFNPEARFHVGNAMARNASIYCLADAAIVVCSEAGKGGTWSGAEENLKKGWVPLWVKPDDAPGSGNPELVRRGAEWLPEEPYPLSQLVDGARPAGQDRLPLEPAAPSLREEPEPYAPAPEDGGLYALFLARMAELTAEKPAGVRRIAECLQLRPGQVEDWLRRALPEGRVLAGKRRGQYAALPGAAHIPAKGDLYALFVDRAVGIVSAEPMSTAGIAERLRVTKPQATEWLKRAADEGRLVRVEKPVRYRAAEASLFGDNA
ncbi:MAG: DNA-processing protein DprA [Alphaproteobacteria bacterium]|nr:DNA-processing protein DprA [Alphaproteobacteria bacterium]